MIRPPIFRSASYLLVVGTDSPSLRAIVLERCREHRLRPYFCRDITEIKLVTDAMSKITAALIFAENMTVAVTASVISPFLLRKIPIRIFSPDPGFQSFINPKCKVVAKQASNDISFAIDELIREMVPPELEQVLLEDGRKVLPVFLEKVPPLKTVSTVGFKFDRQLNFSLVAGNIVGVGILRIKLASIERLLPKSKLASGLDDFQEAMNQWIGSVAARMSILGMNAVVGLHTWFDISSIPELYTLIFFPSAHVTDDESQFAVSVGFVDLTGAPLNFTGINKAVKSDEVEFL